MSSEFDGELICQEIIRIKEYSKCVLIVGMRLRNIKAIQVKLPRNLFVVVSSHFKMAYIAGKSIIWTRV